MRSFIAQGLDATALAFLVMADVYHSGPMDGFSDSQLGKIGNTGLDKLVDAWRISDDVGIRKPDPEIFRLAAERRGATLGRDGWVIGDSLGDRLDRKSSAGG